MNRYHSRVRDLLKRVYGYKHTTFEYPGYISVMVGDVIFHVGTANNKSWGIDYFDSFDAADAGQPDGSEDLGIPEDDPKSAAAAIAAFIRDHYAAVRLS